MSFENSGMISVRNNAKLRNIHRKPKMLNTKPSKVSSMGQKTELLSLNEASARTAKREKMKKLLAILSIVVIALLLSAYFMDVKLNMF